MPALLEAVADATHEWCVTEGEPFLYDARDYGGEVLEQVGGVWGCGRGAGWCRAWALGGAPCCVPAGVLERLWWAAAGEVRGAEAIFIGVAVPGPR
jgi:hypothetical protein